MGGGGGLRGETEGGGFKYLVIFINTYTKPGGILKNMVLMTNLFFAEVYS